MPYSLPRLSPLVLLALQATADTDLPSGWCQAKTTYYTGYGFARSHSCLSADRPGLEAANSATLLPVSGQTVVEARTDTGPTNWPAPSMASNASVTLHVGCSFKRIAHKANPQKKLISSNSALL